MTISRPQVECKSGSSALDAERRTETAKDIFLGILKPQKSLPSRFLYDATGSTLFEKICGTPEYYLTRTELSIIEESGNRIMDFFSMRGGDFIELGSGSARKISAFLHSLPSATLRHIRYIPIDISESALNESVHSLSKTYKNLAILGIRGDFTRRLNLWPASRKIIAFLGSTIGNFTEEQSVSFLSNVGGTMGSEDRLLLGLDILKPEGIIEAAYNDNQGLTRDFNLNILTHLNREMHADFNLNDFEHLAFFNRKEEQVEMHLRARRSTKVFIGDLMLSVPIEAGETIRTEICRKFSRKSASRMLKRAGFSISRWFTDPKGWFALVEARKS
jgi:L-histidine Nalpha-methyltransferase